MNKKFTIGLTLAVIFTMLASMVALADTSPTVATDSQNYAPGDTVKISGADWPAGGSVDVSVSGPNGQALSCAADANDVGAWSCQVSLSSDAANAGDYSYTATAPDVSVDGSFTVTAPPAPVVEPTVAPTEEPTLAPTDVPTDVPTEAATVAPTDVPTDVPTVAPTDVPTEAATVAPMDVPTDVPTEAATVAPTEVPTATSAPALPPFIQSDQLDYAPGALVTLTSGNWQPGESVHLIVNDVIGNSWVLAIDVLADDSGAFTYKFYLPNWFVAQYHVYTYGAASGAATTDFTDKTNASDGDGTMAISPTTVTEGSTGNTLTFTFVSPSGKDFNAGSQATILIPAGWTVPQSSNISVAVGSCTAATLGTITGTGPWIIPINMTCPPSASFAVTYSNVTAPTITGNYTFTTQTKQSGGTLTGITHQPTINVNTMVGTVTVGLQVGALTYGTGGNATYQVTVNRNTGANGMFTVNLSLLAGLPSGASGSFSSSSLTFTGVQDTKTSTLTISTTTATPGGSWPFTVQATNANSSVDSSTGSGTLLVGQANQTISFAALANKTYGNADFGVSATATSGLAVSFSATGNCTVSGGTVHITGAGSCTITASQAGNGNYNAAPDVLRSFSIAPAPLLITASSDTMVYGGTVPTITPIYSGLVAGDLAPATAPTCSTVATNTSPVGTYASSCTGAVDANYTITYAAGSVSVTPAPLTITAKDQSKTYGSTFTFVGTEFTTSGLVNSDAVTSVTLTSGGAAATATVAGSTYAIVPSAAVGTGLGNYTISYHNGALTVNPKGLTITANDRTKILGATVTFLGTEFTTSGLVNGDTVATVTLTSAGAAASATVAGSPYPIVPSAAVGTGLGNYTITYVDGKLTINYRWDGFLQPVNDTAHGLTCGTPCPLSIFKGGSTIPVKFVLKDASGNVILSSGAPTWLTPVQSGLMTASVDESTYTLAPSGGNTYTWDGSQYHYNWNTKGLPTGYYYIIGVKLDDGTTHYVYIGLR